MYQPWEVYQRISPELRSTLEKKKAGEHFLTNDGVFSLELSCYKALPAILTDDPSWNACVATNPSLYERRDYKNIPYISDGIFYAGTDYNSKGKIEVRSAYAIGNLLDPDCMQAIVELLEGYGKLGPLIKHLHVGWSIQWRDEDGYETYKQLERSLEIAKRRVIAKSSFNKHIFLEELGYKGIQETSLETIIKCAERYGLDNPVPEEQTSFSGLVVSCVLDEKVETKNPLVYVKLDHRRHILEREATYLRDAWNIPLLRPITPRLLDLVAEEGSKYTALITYDTRNKHLISEEDRLAYEQLQEKIFEITSEILSLSKESFFKNSSTQDMFNRALSHTLMRTYLEKSEYARPVIPPVPSMDHLRQRLAQTANLEWKEMIGDMLSIYENLEPHLQRYAAQEGTIIVHRDSRAENIWDGPKGTRVLGDPAFAFRCNPEFDIAQMENPSVERHVREYLEFRSALEAEVGVLPYESPEPFTFLGRVTELAFAHALRLAAWKSFQDQDPLKYILLAQHYAHMQEAWTRLA